MYTPGICPGMYPLVYVRVYTPGYTVHPAVHSRTAAAVTGLTRLAALRRAVTEQSVTDAGVTVACVTDECVLPTPVSLLGKKCPSPYVIPYGGRSLCAEWSPFGHPIVADNEAMIVSRYSRFSQECGNQAGICAGLSLPHLHPFHCPRVE